VRGVAGPLLTPDPGGVPQRSVRLVENDEQTENHKKFSLSGSSRTRKGAANVAKVGMATCKSRAASNAITARWMATAGAMVKQSGLLSAHPKIGVEVPCTEWEPRKRIAARIRSGGYGPTGCIRNECATAWSRNGRSSAQPGIEPITCSTKGLLNEQGNFDSDARPAKPGKPPSPVRFRAKDGALVVVRARESRAHGEGEQ